MNSASDPFNSSPQAPPFGGVPRGREGLILQRGGEELVLRKSGDRFTVAPLPPSDSAATNYRQTAGLDELLRSLPVIERLPIPGKAFQELQVAPGALEAAMAQARLSPATRYVSHVYHFHNDPRARVYLTDEITVQFERPLTPAMVQATTAPLGLLYQGPVDGLDNTYIFAVGKRAQENPVKLANRLMTLPDVLLAEANVVLPSESSYRPKDSLYPQQWYLNHSGNGVEQSVNSHISAEQAWDLTRGDRSIVIAVADDGIDISHPDFQGVGKIVAPRDFYDRDFTPQPGGEVDNHGTAVAGIALAEETGTGIVGVAPGCALMPIRTTGFLDDASVEAVFDWATENGAAVICCSWGAGAVRFPLSLRQRAAITRAATRGRNGKGCLITFAAGNFNRPLNSTVEEQGWPKALLAGVTTWLNGFAVHPDVITVGACTSQGKKAAYSNWGNELFLCAPSNNAPPAIWLEETGYIEVPPKYNYRLPGAPVITTDRLGPQGYSTDNFTEAFGGTSSACPVVAGVIGLMLSVNPNLTTAEVKQILQNSADKVIDREVDPQFKVNFGTYEANGHSQWFGYGKVNAFKAVQQVQQSLQGPTKPQQEYKVASSQVMPLQDGSTTLSALRVEQAGLVKTLAIAINLEHGFLGDLEIYLVAPSTDKILLQNRTLGRRTQLQATYDLQTTPLLKRIMQRPAQGLWQLEIKDYAKSHSGQLKGWQLTLGI
jgi:subtilisin family serine protease/subtilisin-like proprotein convertase family protein